ncbi:hypothetical protein AAEX37_01989 [Oligella sp. MSHR50489EDL]
MRGFWFWFWEITGAVALFVLPFIYWILLSPFF